MGSFNEDNSVEQLVLLMLGTQAWKYIAFEDLKRAYNDIFVDDMVKILL